MFSVGIRTGLRLRPFSSVNLPQSSRSGLPVHPSVFDQRARFNSRGITLYRKLVFLTRDLDLPSHLHSRVDLTAQSNLQNLTVNNSGSFEIQQARREKRRLLFPVRPEDVSANRKKRVDEFFRERRV